MVKHVKNSLETIDWFVLFDFLKIKKKTKKNNFIFLLNITWQHVISRDNMWYHMTTRDIMWRHVISRDITVCGLGAWAVVGGDDIMWYHSISCRVDDVEYDIWIWRYIIIYHQYIMCRYHVHVSSRTRHDIDMISQGEKKKMISRYIMCRRGTWYIMILEMIHNDISW